MVAGFVRACYGRNVASVSRFFYANAPLLEYYLYQHPKGSFGVSCHCFLQKLISVFGGNLNYWGIKGSSIGSTWGYPIETIDTGGEGGIRTPGRGFSPYNGLANRRLQPLGHLSETNGRKHCNLQLHLVTVSLFDCCTLVHTVTQLLWRQRPRCAGYDALLS